MNTTPQDSKRSAPPPDLARINAKKQPEETPAIENIKITIKKKHKHGDSEKARAKETEKERLEKVKAKVRADFQLGIS